MEKHLEISLKLPFQRCIFFLGLLECPHASAACIYPCKTIKTLNGYIYEVARIARNITRGRYYIIVVLNNYIIRNYRRGPKSISSV